MKLFFEHLFFNRWIRNSRSCSSIYSFRCVQSVHHDTMSIKTPGSDHFVNSIRCHFDCSTLSQMPIKERGLSIASTTDGALLPRPTSFHLIEDPCLRLKLAARRPNPQSTQARHRSNSHGLHDLWRPSAWNSELCPSYALNSYRGIQ